MSKTLMLLGGSRYLMPVIEMAHELDCKVITCDYLPDNYAHKFSDKYVNVSIIEKDAVLKVANAYDIDGIMSFACDPGVLTAAYVAEKMELPYGGSYESVEILQNKRKFRDFLLSNGFNTPKAKGVNNVRDAKDVIDDFRFPFIVKPVDSAGSKGVTKVEKKEAIIGAVERAFNNSINGEIVIEEFIDCKGHPSDSECFSIDGNMCFVSFSAQRFDASCENPFVPAGFTWMSTISEKNQNILSEELCRLIQLLKMRTTLYNVEARESREGIPYIMEVSPRGGGNRLAEMIRYSTGVDLIKLAILASLGEQITDIPIYDQDYKWAEIVLHSKRQGEFKEIRVADCIKDYIVDMDIWVKQGEVIESFSGANKAIGTMIMRFDSVEMTNKVMDDFDKYISVETNL